MCTHTCTHTCTRKLPPTGETKGNSSPYILPGVGEAGYWRPPSTPPPPERNPSAFRSWAASGLVLGSAAPGAVAPDAMEDGCSAPRRPFLVCRATMQATPAAPGLWDTSRTGPQPSVPPPHSSCPLPRCILHTIPRSTQKADLMGSTLLEPLLWPARPPPGSCPPQPRLIPAVLPLAGASSQVAPFVPFSSSVPGETVVFCSSQTVF